MSDPTVNHNRIVSTVALDLGAQAVAHAGTAATPDTAASSAYGDCPPGEKALPDVTEYLRYNLRGGPPVRDRRRPPNIAVVEDEAQYQALLSQARMALDRQRQRAAGYLERGNLRDYRYFFAKVYSYVTEYEIAFCESKAYYYPTYVLKCVLYFEKLYDDNVRAFDRPGARVEDHWRQAFETTAGAQRRAEDAYDMLLQAREPEERGGLALHAVTQSMLGAVESLTASMLAHIRFDLPRAEAWVFNQGYRSMTGVQMSDFAHDFMSMSGVFDRAGEAMLPDMANKLAARVGLIPRMVQDTLMTYIFGADMASERADTWRRALALSLEHPDDFGPYSFGGPEGVQGNATAGDHMSGIRSLSDSALRPDMSQPMDTGDDDSARREISTKTDDEIADLPAIRRVQYLRMLQRGSTTDDDEDVILRILQCSHSDLVLVVDGADAWDLMYALDGQQARDLRQLLRSGYYANTALHTALRLARRAMDGETAEWEEQMVADIVEARNDRVELIRLIGQQYRDMSGADDFQRGLNKVEWQLDGEDEDRVHRVLAKDSNVPRATSGP